MGILLQVGNILATGMYYVFSHCEVWLVVVRFNLKDVKD